MGLPIWNYIRRRACEALLAGFQDALEFLEHQDQPQAIHSAAQSIKRRLHDFDEAQRAGNRTENSPSQPALQDQRQSVSPKPNGSPQTGTPSPQNQSQQNAPRRGPGRPRKEVHG